MEIPLKSLAWCFEKKSFDKSIWTLVKASQSRFIVQPGFASPIKTGRGVFRIVDKMPKRQTLSSAKQAPDVKSNYVCSHFSVASALSPIFTPIRINVCRRFARKFDSASAVTTAKRSGWQTESKLPATVASRLVVGESRARLERMFYVVII